MTEPKNLPEPDTDLIVRLLAVVVALPEKFLEEYARKTQSAVLY
jgi:hypothetical protein